MKSSEGTVLKTRAEFMAVKWEYIIRNILGQY